MNLEVLIGNIRLKNPLIIASGTFGFGEKFKRVIQRAGGFITKGITKEERKGNEFPRIWDGGGYLLNSIGLENPGVEKFKKEILPLVFKNRVFFMVNVAGFSVDEFFYIVEMLKDESIDGFELNLSCPNVKKDYKLIGAVPKSVRKIVRGVKSITDKPIFVKLTPNYCDPIEIAEICEEEKADAVVVFNTLFGMRVDIEKRKPYFKSVRGGISGPGVKPFVLYSVYEISKRVKIPVVASGGVTNGEDVLEYLLVGAKAVEIGSVNLRDPFALIRILKELRILLKKLKIKRIEEIIGKMEVKDET